MKLVADIHEYYASYSIPLLQMFKHPYTLQCIFSLLHSKLVYSASSLCIEAITKACVIVDLLQNNEVSF